MSEDTQAVSEVVEQTTTAPETAPVEETKSEVAEPANVQQDDGQLVPQETEAKEVPKADDTAGADGADETDAEPQGDEQLAPKSQKRFQQLANENRELKEALQRLESQENQVATEQELLNEVNPETGDYYTPAEAERVARQQALERQAQNTAQERFRLEIQQNQQAVQDDSLRAVQEFPVLDESSPEFKPELAAEFDDVLADSLVYADPNGQQYTGSQLIAGGVALTDPRLTLVRATTSPYKLAKAIATASKVNDAKNRAQAQRSTERMLANADNPGGSGKGEQPFTKLSASEMAEKLRAKGYDI
jgi:hypothetical protein